MGTSFVLASMARLHFGVTLPTDRATLKTAYRQAARKLHTDTSGSDTKAAFQDMQAAYEALTAPGAAGVFTDAPVGLLQYTEEGTLLSALGLGVGPHKNGKECAACKGRGYNTHKRRRVEWLPYPPCPRCCLIQSTWGCPTCGGRNGLGGQFRHKDTITEMHAVCATCQGKGEIELMNPVIPKGFLGAGHMTQKERKRLDI